MADGSESTIICVDNSDYNINEDIYPDRFVSLRDSLNIICENKILSLDHHVGVLLMAGERCKILVALTNSLGKLLNCIHDIQIEGTCDILKSLSIAQLALKHRTNRNAHQKIVLLLGSPCTANEKHLMNLAKQLKKNNIGIEIVNYGSTSANRDILKRLYENVNNNENSKYIEVPEDATNISSFIMNAFSNHTYCTFDDMNVNPDIFNTVRNTVREDDTANANTSSGLNAPPVATTTTNTDRTNDMPTMEEIENMQDIDSDLREALLLSLREYNERQIESVEAPPNVPEVAAENSNEKNDTNAPLNITISEIQNEVSEKEERNVITSIENGHTEQSEKKESNEQEDQNENK